MTFYEFLSLKNDVNVPSKSNKQNKFENKLFFVGVLKVTDGTAGSGSISQRYGFQDPYQNLTRSDRAFDWTADCYFNFAVYLSFQIQG